MPMKDKFFGLLLALIAILVVFPFFRNFPIVNALLKVFITAVLLLSVYAISENKRSLFIASGLCTPGIIFNWMSHFYDHSVPIIFANLFIFLFSIYIIYEILIKIFSSKSVTIHLIYGALCVYFLIGFAWGFLFNVIEIINPGSFKLNTLNFVNGEHSLTAPKNLPSFIYYSFITLTTLGYGDITPLTPPAQSLSAFEAIIGQLYLTVLVAWLVGLLVANRE